MGLLPRIGLGAVTFGREIDREASFRILDHAVEQGIRVIDTAESYGDGASERVLGEWLRSRGAAGLVSVHSKLSFSFRPEAVRPALVRSLDRLGVDRVPLYYLHVPPTGAPPGEVMAALLETLREGLIGGIGCSNFTASQLREALRFGPIAACQPIFNFAVPDARRDVFPFCKQHRIRIVSYSPLGAGFLTGKYGPRGERIPAGARFDVVPGHRAVYFRPDCFVRLAILARMTRETRVPRHLLALAWVLRCSLVDTMLVGARETGHVDHAIEAANLELSDEVWERLDQEVAAL